MVRLRVADGGADRVRVTERRRRQQLQPVRDRITLGGVIGAGLAAESVRVLGDRAVEDVQVLGIHSEQPGLERAHGDVRRTDVLVELDAEALRLQRLAVELTEDELLGVVLVTDRDRRLAGPRQRGRRRGRGRRRTRGRRRRGLGAARLRGDRVGVGARRPARRARDRGRDRKTGSDRRCSGQAGRRAHHSWTAIILAPTGAHTPAARRASAWAAFSNWSSSGASPSSSPRAVAISQSANHAFLGSRGPCR